MGEIPFLEHTWMLRVLNKTFSGFTSIQQVVYLVSTDLKKDASDWTLIFTKDRGEHSQEILEVVIAVLVRTRRQQE